MIELNSKEELQKVKDDIGMSVVEFGTEWCGKCRSIEKQLDEIQPDYSGLNFYKLDLDKVDVADEYGINDLPVVIAFYKGKEVSRLNDANLDDWMRFIILPW